MTAVDELLLDSPAARPCNHPRAQHQHDTMQAYRQDRCRCLPCRAANNDYQRHRYRQVAYGRWNAWVDAEPSRAYVRRLLDAGLREQSIAKLSGVDRSTLRLLMRGRSDRPPSVRLLARTERKLLTVKVDRARPVVPDLLTMKEAAV